MSCASPTRQPQRFEAATPRASSRVCYPADEQLDVAAFWDKAATSLVAGRMRLLFVADEIPDSLRRIVEFLNAQMPTVEVLAVEIKPFGRGKGKTFVPRVFGTTAKPVSGIRRRLDRESFLAEFASAETRSAAARLLDVAEQSGAQLSWGPRERHDPCRLCWLGLASDRRVAQHSLNGRLGMDEN